MDLRICWEFSNVQTKSSTLKLTGIATGDFTGSN